MKQVINLSIDVSKIDKTAMYKSPKTGAVYLNVAVLIREEVDQYGNHGMIVQSLPKERSSERGAILGNAKIKQTSVAVATAPDDDDIPF